MSRRLEIIDAQIIAAEDALCKLHDSRNRAAAGLAAENEKPAPQSQMEAVLAVFKIVREGNLLATRPEDIITDVKAIVLVDQWIVGGIGCPADAIRIAGVGAFSTQGLRTLLALWLVNATRALRTIRESQGA